MSVGRPEQRIVVTAPVPPDVRAVMERRLTEAGLQVIPNPGGVGVLGADDLAALLPVASGIVIGPGELSAELIDSAPRLRAISKFGVGVEAIDLDAATRAGIGVTSTPGVNADSVADLTLALILSLARRLPEVTAALRAGRFERAAGMELAGKTLGLVGLGAIGQAVARRAQAFGMQVVGRAPTSAADYAGEQGIELAPLEELLPRCEVLSVHTPLDDCTSGLIGASELAALPRGALVINTARGGIIDEAALLAALRSGHLGGAGLDVFADEPPGDNPLLALDSVIATPHVGGATREAFLRAGLAAVDNLLALLHGEAPRALLNREALRVRGS